MDQLTRLTQQIVAFRDARDWEQFHTPKNLAAAIAVEAGELQEQFLWDEDGVDPAAPVDDAISEEIADVLIYALLFCHQLDIDPKKAIQRKLETNRERYPVDKARGRSTKYTELEDS